MRAKGPNSTSEAERQQRHAANRNRERIKQRLKRFLSKKLPKKQWELKTIDGRKLYLNARTLSEAKKKAVKNGFIDYWREIIEAKPFDDTSPTARTADKNL